MRATTASVRIRPPRGHSSSGKGAPVKNPTPGPKVYPLRGPVRAVLPRLAPRAGGYAVSNKGGPVRNPGPAIQFRLGIPYSNWVLGNVYT